MALIKCADCGREVSDSAPACPGCGRPLTASAPTPSSPRTKLKRKSEMVGTGCFVQGLGLVIGVGLLLLGPIGWVLGPLLGIVLFLVGSRMSLKYVCGNCGNRVSEHATAKLCPSCHASFE